MAYAVSLLSPVSIATFIPISESSRTAVLLLSLTVSANAITPIIFPFFAKNRGVFPSFASLSVILSKEFDFIPLAFISLIFPASIKLPSASADMPIPP